MSCSELQLLIVVLTRMEPQYGAAQSLTVNMNDLLMDYTLCIVKKYFLAWTFGNEFITSGCLHSKNFLTAV